MRPPPSRRRASRAGSTSRSTSTAAPGDTSRLFIVEKTGTIKILDLNTGPGPRHAVSHRPGRHRKRARPARPRLRSGLRQPTARSTSMHLDAPAPHNEVRRYHVSGNPNVAAREPATVILDVGPSTNGNHNAGWLGFGPDGYLYIASGEVGVAGERADLDQPARQDPAHRCRPAASGYQIPADNPFVGDGGGAREEIFASACAIRGGRASIPRPASFFIGDVGESPFEEINLGQKRRELRLAERRRHRAPTRPSSIRSTPTRTASGSRSPAAMSIAAKATA